MTPIEAFNYMADLRNFAEWDPGVEEVSQVEGDGAGSDAVFDVVVKAVPKPLTLRYRTIEFEPSSSVVAKAESNLLTSLDTITVDPNGDGSAVTYEAELTLNGALGLLDPLLRVVFKRIGDRAADGMVRVLDGQRVAG